MGVNLTTERTESIRRGARYFKSKRSEVGLSSVVFIPIEAELL
jgi:hypothetical protein